MAVDSAIRRRAKCCSHTPRVQPSISTLRVDRATRDEQFFSLSLSRHGDAEGWEHVSTKSDRDVVSGV
jgi:hypothetical protein